MLIAAQNPGIRYEVVPITKGFKVVHVALKPAFRDLPKDVTEGESASSHSRNYFDGHFQ